MQQFPRVVLFFVCLFGRIFSSADSGCLRIMFKPHQLGTCIESSGRSLQCLLKKILAVYSVYCQFIPWPENVLRQCPLWSWLWKIERLPPLYAGLFINVKQLLHTSLYGCLLFWILSCFPASFLFRADESWTRIILRVQITWCIICLINVLCFQSTLLVRLTKQWRNIFE